MPPTQFLTHFSQDGWDYGPAGSGLVEGPRVGVSRSSGGGCWEVFVEMIGRLQVWAGEASIKGAGGAAPALRMSFRALVLYVAC